MHRTSISIIAVCALSARLVCAADAPNPAEARLREQLKNTMIQLRTAETERATLQAAQAENEKKNKDLTARVDSLMKDLTATRDTTEKMIATLKNKQTDQEAEIVRLKAALEKWQVAQKQAMDLAATKESQRAKLANDVIALQRKVADQQVKNAEMFKLGNEILTRYEKFGLGEALTAREPFTGITRVKLQSLFQDYSDKLVDQTIKP